MQLMENQMSTINLKKIHSIFYFSTLDFWTTEQLHGYGWESGGTIDLWWELNKFQGFPKKNLQLILFKTNVP